MNVSDKQWKNLFLVCAGLFIGAAFCMKWMEGDLLVNGEKFTIMGLELFYSKEKVMALLGNPGDPIKTILNYHLHFDFAFMAGVFPGIAALCMMVRGKVRSSVFKKMLFLLALLQLAAWAGDIYENLSLIKWVKEPVIGDEFALYHFIVAAKWIIALTGALVPGVVLLFPRKKELKTHFIF
ncbi:MAG: hypothetical protein WDO71_24270 [Bacteroidota bacterium]